MCLSGAIEKLTDEQWSVVKEAMDAYRLAAPVIKYGTSRKFAELGESWRRPQGWQALSRHSDDQWLVVLHGYENAPSTVEIPAPAGDWKLATRFGGSGDPVLSGGKVVLDVGGDFTGQVLLWEK
jgi:alpha-galactosidase